MIIQPPIYWLPRTGQTTSYPNGDDTDRDDGHYQAGAPITTRFVDNGNGTVSDRVTGLQWVQQPELLVLGGTGDAVGKGNWADATEYAAGDVVNDGGVMYQCILGHTGDGAGNNQPSKPDAAHWVLDPWTADAVDPLDAPDTMAWLAAIANCEALDYAGFTDWRLPNILELCSLHNPDKVASPPIDLTMFPNTIRDKYCTSTTYKSSTTYSYRVNFANKYLDASITTKVTEAYLRPVRGGRING